jgi:rhodanese-related sulfurtransferase
MSALCVDSLTNPVDAAADARSRRRAQGAKFVQSSLAAATLKRFGLDVSDVVGGFQAWRETGLPVDR